MKGEPTRQQPCPSDRGTVSCTGSLSFSVFVDENRRMYSNSPYGAVTLPISHGPVAVFVSDLDDLLRGVFWVLNRFLKYTIVEYITNIK